MVGLIVARSKNNVIGSKGKIPWKGNIPGEQKQFRELTTGNTVIMGRKTYEDIGHPLPNRLNIVVSTKAHYEGENLITVDTLDKALKLATNNIYIIGGYGLYKEALKIVDVMYITEINLEVKDGDVFFPSFNEDEFDKVLTEENELYKRYTYERKNFDK